MRWMSFALTTRQFREQTKDVTRRLGWKNAKPGQRLQGAVKCQGLKKGEHPERLGIIEVVRVNPEPLNVITKAEVIREGFPDMTPAEFVAMFCKHNKCEPSEVITRIEFKYLEASS